jgi:hypothetical protein
VIGDKSTAGVQNAEGAIKVQSPERAIKVQSPPGDIAARLGQMVVIPSDFGKIGEAGMGGLGSGRWQGPRPGRRPTVGEVPGLDADLAATQAGVPPNPGLTSVALDVAGPAVTLEAVACRFGGVRWWWRCPACDARRLRLYRTDGRWACRSCLGLTYESRRESWRWDSFVRFLYATGIVTVEQGWTPELLRRLVCGQPGEWALRRRRRRKRPPGFGESMRRHLHGRTSEWGRKRRLRVAVDATESGLVGAGRPRPPSP